MIFAYIFKFLSNNINMKKLYMAWKIFTFVVIVSFIVLMGFYLYAYITPKIDIRSANRIVMYDNDENEFYSNSSNTNWVS